MKVDKATKSAVRAIFVSDLTRAIYEIEHLNRSAISFGIRDFDATSIKKLLFDLQERIMSS
jgi:hypothetical protein